MNERRFVADASAILALLKQEAIHRFDPGRLFRSTISAVNLSEVLERLRVGGMSEAAADEAIDTLSLDVIDFSASHARIAAYLRPYTRRAGLSLGDRACLALGLEVGGPVVTADRAWAGLDVGVEIVLIR